MVVKDSNGSTLYANPAFANLLGYRPDEVADFNLETLLHPHDLIEVRERTARMRGGHFEAYRAERRYRHRNGSFVWVTVHVSALRRDDAGRMTHYLVQIVDIDRQKAVQAALIETERRASFALTSAGQWVWDLDILGRRVWRSPQWKTALGYRDDELPDDPEPWRIVHADDRASVEAAFERVVTGKSEV
ncbi:MAG TPA: PAS domain S-box protein, partial [Geminicoccus sp.]|uniref:PAS domain-containing protein n=1 Tax=Geminicoccus sp. TaxID=2024832 RepID=UPI002E34CB57